MRTIKRYIKKAVNYNIFTAALYNVFLLDEKFSRILRNQLLNYQIHDYEFSAHFMFIRIHLMYILYFIVIRFNLFLLSAQKLIVYQILFLITQIHLFIQRLYYNITLLS